MATRGNLVRANQWFDNSDDSNRAFEISAEVQYTGDKKIANIVGGQVKKGDLLLCNFSHSGSSFSCTFYGIGSNEQVEVITALNAFVVDVAKDLAVNM